ncbi:MAG: prolipoprotein diacylglyceryl transferase family protein [Acidobacteriaceae bacterium]
MHPLLFHFGHVAIPTYGVCTALGLLAALILSVRTAKGMGLKSDKVWNLELVAILTAIITARLLLVFGHPWLYHAHPFWFLGLIALPNVWYSLGGAAIGMLVAVQYSMAERLPLLRTMDALAPSAALAFCINRIGAFCGGAAWGTRTGLPWGVTYRSAVAYLWYRAPLGVRLQPVQLYDAAASLGILVLLLWMVSRRGAVRNGEIAGTWLFLYGLCRYFVEFLRGDAARQPLLNGAVTLAQVMAVAGVILGGVLWLVSTPEPEPMEEEPERY